MKITTLKKVEKKELKEIQKLMDQLSADPTAYKPLKLAIVKKAVKSPNTVIVVVKDAKRIVGMGTLNILYGMRGSTGYIDDVIIHESYRGKGLGEQISKEILRIGKKRKLRRIDLTSRPYRIAANKLYQKLGFELRETNAYTIKP